MKKNKARKEDGDHREPILSRVMKSDTERVTFVRIFRSSTYLQERFPGRGCWRAKGRVIGDTCQKVKKKSIVYRVV